MTRIFLIRHAEAEGNIYRRAHGHYEGQITGRGFTQMEFLRKRFEAETIDAVYSSDLTRTRVTASALAEPRGLPIDTTERIREVNIGVWEDLPWGEIEHSDPEQFDYFNNDPARWNIPGGEDYANIRTRMCDFLKEIGQKHDGGRGAVAAFSHGFAIRAFTCEMLGYPSHETTKVPYCDNTAVALVQYDNGKLTLEYSGDNSHLQNENSTFARQTWWRGVREKGLRFKNLLSFEKESKQRKLYGASRNFKGFAAYLEDEEVGRLELGVDGDGGRIERIRVEPGFRRRGYGVQLIGQAVSVCRKHGGGKLQAPATDDSAEFFIKHGFKRVSDAVMEKDILQKRWM